MVKHEVLITVQSFCFGGGIKLFC